MFGEFEILTQIRKNFEKLKNFGNSGKFSEFGEFRELQEVREFAKCRKFKEIQKSYVLNNFVNFQYLMAFQKVSRIFSTSWNFKNLPKF